MQAKPPASLDLFFVPVGNNTRPLVFAHRGASAYAPENTLAAFQLAFDMGADGIELDVSLTSDGALVVFHADTNPRHATHGRSSLHGMTLDEVRQLDAGSWFGPRFAKERIPTLGEVFSAVGRRGLINVELKDFTIAENGLEAAVIRAIQEHKLEKSALLTSFNPIRLWRCRRVDASLPRGLIYENKLPIFLRRAWFRPLVHPAWLNPEYAMVDRQYLDWAHRKRYRVNTWAVDDPEEMKRLGNLGVDGIMSNRPDVLRKTVDECHKVGAVQDERACGS